MFQLPEPAQVVEARTGDAVYEVLQCEFAVEQNPRSAANNGLAGLHVGGQGFLMTSTPSQNV